MPAFDLHFSRARLFGVAVMACLPACGFEATLPGVTSDVDAMPSIVCGDLTCDPHAVCLESPTRCACDDGFTGTGLACADVDECASGNGGCAAACANTTGGFTCYAPEHCVDVTAQDPTFAGGAVTLYLGGDAAKPWTAFCTAAGLEYLSLSAANNYAQYSGNTNVRTTYTKIRVVVSGVTITVDIDDKTFSTSTGSLMHGADTVTSMPYAVAMDCEGSGNQSGVAKIDLAGTPFVVTDPFANRGSGASGTSTITGGGRQVSLTGGGNCGWRAPAPAPYNPYNSIPDAAILDLGYAP